MTLGGVGQSGFSLRIFEKLSVSEPGSQKTALSAWVDGNCRSCRMQTTCNGGPRGVTSVPL